MTNEFEKPERYSESAAWEEASKMKDKIEKGEAADLPEAERKVEDDAIGEAVNDTIEDAQLKLYNNEVVQMRKRGFPENKIEILESAFTEFMTEQRKLMLELKGDYSLGKLRQKIPNNLFLWIFEDAARGIRENNKKSPDERERDRDGLADDIRNLAEKKKRGTDQH